MDFIRQDSAWTWAYKSRFIDNCDLFTEAIAKRKDDVEFMFVWVYNLFLHFQQKKMFVRNPLEIQFRFVCLSEFWSINSNCALHYCRQHFVTVLWLYKEPTTVNTNNITWIVIFQIHSFAISLWQLYSHVSQNQITVETPYCIVTAEAKVGFLFLIWIKVWWHLTDCAIFVTFVFSVKNYG